MRISVFYKIASAFCFAGFVKERAKRFSVRINVFTGNVTLCRGQQVACEPRVGRTFLKGETGAQEVVLHSVEVSYKVSRTLRNLVEQHRCRVLGARTVLCLPCAWCLPVAAALETE